MLNKNLKIDLVYGMFIIDYFYELQNLKTNSKILEGSISIDKIKKLGFGNIKNIFLKKSFDFNNNISKLDNKNILLRMKKFYLIK